VTALLQAMGPALIQSAWSMSVSGDPRAARASDADGEARAEQEPTARERIGYNLNTCHVWAEDGELVGRVLSGERLGPPLPIQQRLREHGKDPNVFWKRPV
jgi:hypothetical protein